MIDKHKLQERMARQRIGTLADLAAEVGVSPNTVSKWRKGEDASRLHVNALCHVLDCEPRDIAAAQCSN